MEGVLNYCSLPYLHPRDHSYKRKTTLDPSQDHQLTPRSHAIHIYIHTYIHPSTLPRSPPPTRPRDHLPTRGGEKGKKAKEKVSLAEIYIPSCHRKSLLAAPSDRNRTSYLSLNMCHYALSIYPCGDSYILPSSLCGNAPRCAVFEVVSAQRLMVDCFLCQRSPRRRKLPARARGIYAPS